MSYVKITTPDTIYVEVTAADPARLAEAEADADALGALLADRRRIVGGSVGIFGFTETATAHSFAHSFARAVAGKGEPREARVLPALSESTGV